MRWFHPICVLAFAASATAHDTQHPADHAEPADHPAAAAPSHASPPQYAAPSAHVASPPPARAIAPGGATSPRRVPPPNWRDGMRRPQAPVGTPIDRWHRGNPQQEHPHGAGGNYHHDHRRWNGDMHQDHHRWHGGHWWHGNVGSRGGWWWIVGPEWYWYPAPVYPAPDPDVPPGMEPGYWYWCDDYQDYYPNVTDCPSPWVQEVPDD